MPGVHKMTWNRCSYCGRYFKTVACKIGQIRGNGKGRGHLCSVKCRFSWMREQEKWPPKCDWSGAGNGAWKGGITYHVRGYIYQYAPDHPRRHNNYVLQHILVAEQTLGRPLNDSEVVHHINGNKADNNPENLQVFPSSSAHSLHHAAMRRQKGA